MKLEIFDVAHGACALLTSDDGKRLMIDCGQNADAGWRPGTMLAGRGVTYLDALLVTNYDEDHVRGLPNLRSTVGIGLLYRNRAVTPETIRQLKSEDGMGNGIQNLVDMATQYTFFGGAQLTMPNMRFQTFWNSYPNFEDENNLSLVLYLSIGGINFLFPGDLEDAGWKALLNNPAFAALMPTLHVLVASHHGRESGICVDLFDKHGCKPEIVVISDKAYMYDTQKTVPYYKSKCSGISNFRGQKRWVLTTRNDGQITFEWGADGAILGVY